LKPAAQAALGRLKIWLLEAAFPVWWEGGADRAAGGYFDRLGFDGASADAPKRVRVQARQAYAYALAPQLGWTGAAEAASRHGLEFLRRRRAPDGLYRLGPRRDSDWDGMGELYDQAFVLLALATCRAAFGDPGLEAEADALVERLAAFAHPIGGFAETPGLAAPLFANPNMHLFESFLAWAAVSANPAWQALADRQGELALARLIDPSTGALHEGYGPDWTRLPAPVIWPGHLYEWAWLLLRWRPEDSAALAAARRLTDLAERRGVDRRRKVAIFALDGALEPTDRGARLWAQTERIKAAALIASLTGDQDYWSVVAEACEALERFFQTPRPGLWRDRLTHEGSFVEEPAPASSFYHIVCAIAELERLAG